MPTICPKDMTACVDDICRACGVCLATGAEMLDVCHRCRHVYSDDLGIECQCDPDDDAASGEWT